MYGEFQSIATNIKKQQHLTDYALVTKTMEEIVQFIQLLQFMNIIFGVIAKIVGNDIKDVDDVVFETEDDILSWTKSATADLLNELQFLEKPTFSNRFMVAWFYYSKHSEFMITFIEAMTNFKFINNTDFPENGFFLYPKYYAQNPCYINLKKDQSTIYYTYDRDYYNKYSVIHQEQVRRGVYNLYFSVKQRKIYWRDAAIDTSVLSFGQGEVMYAAPRGHNGHGGFMHDFVMFKISEKVWVIFHGNRKKYKFVYFSNPFLDECRLKFTDDEGEKTQFVMEKR
eukprot:63344_1